MLPDMKKQSDEISIHAKKFHRVILHGIDPKKETLESFTISPNHDGKQKPDNYIAAQLEI